MSEARSWSDTPLSAEDGWDTAAVYIPGGRGKERLPLTGGWLISCQGNQQRDTPLTASLITYYQLGPGAFI